MSRISKGKRRMLLTAISAGLLGSSAFALRPRDKGAPHTEYFATMSQALIAAGIVTPTVVIDRERLLANANTVTRNVAKPMALRLVAKSLPCLPLLDESMRAMQTQRLMVFNLPDLQQIAEHRGSTELLLGKPMPVAAAALFYDRFKGGEFQAERQLQWLIDTPERLMQYRDLARNRQLTMRINIEIDIGLHRGGVADLRALQHMADIFQSEPRLLWSGLMGYDAHVPKLPGLPGMRAQALTEAKKKYAEYKEYATSAKFAYAALEKHTVSELLTFNTAGSATYRLHDANGPANEISLGSALVKPSDFDIDTLQDLLPAVFIATPVLKASGKFLLPNGVEWIGQALGTWDINQRSAYFIYGGNWMADPVSPPGLSVSSLYGTSSNQQILVGSGAQNLQPDDFIFLRPRQSEAVLQQFGDIALMEGGRITQRWPVLSI